MLELIKSKAREVMPSGIRAFLYGSRARGEAHSDSDWDILILVDAPSANIGLYDSLAYPLTELHPSSLLFRRNVEQDAIALV